MDEVPTFTGQSEEDIGDLKELWDAVPLAKQELSGKQFSDLVYSVIGTNYCAMLFGPGQFVVINLLYLLPLVDFFDDTDKIELHFYGEDQPMRVSSEKAQLEVFIAPRINSN